MEKVVRVFSTFREAEEADAREEARLTPEQRLEIFFALRERYHPDVNQQRLARVCRVTELERS